MSCELIYLNISPILSSKGRFIKPIQNPCKPTSVALELLWINERIASGAVYARSRASCFKEAKPLKAWAMLSMPASLTVLLLKSEESFLLRLLKANLKILYKREAAQMLPKSM